MSGLILPRRTFLKGLGAALGLVAAPAVIRVAPIMRVKPVPLWVPQVWALSDKSLTEMAEHALTEAQLRRRFSLPPGPHDGISLGQISYYVRLDELGYERGRYSGRARAILDDDRSLWFGNERGPPAPHYA